MMSGRNNQRQDEQNQKFVDVIASELNRSVEELNSKDASDLARVRYQALDSLNSSANKSLLSWWLLPAAAMAMLLVAVITYSVMPLMPTSTDYSIYDSLDYDEIVISQGGSIQNGWLLLAEQYEVYEEIDISDELYEELEFHEWLDAYDS